MSALKAGPAVPNWLAAGLIGAVLGAGAGFYGSNWNVKGTAGSGPPGRGGGMPGGGMGGGMGAMMGGGRGGAQDHPQAATLVRTVGALATLERARGKELTAEQRQKLSGTTAKLASADKMTEEECEASLNEIKGTLNADQQAVLEEMTSRPGGGRGGGGGGRGGPGGLGGAPGGNGPAGRNGPGRGIMGGMGGGMMGGMGGGQAPDYDHPFKEGRGHDRLEELATLLKK